MQSSNPNNLSNTTDNQLPYPAPTVTPQSSPVYPWPPFYPPPFGHVPVVAGTPSAIPVGTAAPAAPQFYPPMMYVPYNPYYAMPPPPSLPGTPGGDVKAIERHIAALLGRVSISNDHPATEAPPAVLPPASLVSRQLADQDDTLADEEPPATVPSLPVEREYHPPPPRRRSREMPRPGVLSRLTVNMMQLFEQLRPPPTDMSKRQELLKRLQKVVSAHFRNHRAELHLFGSSANDFSLRNADMDICFVVDEAAGSREEIVETLAKLLKECETFKNVMTLPKARVPIAKFTDELTGISCDICINNVLAISNTRLLSDYAKLDPRLRQIGYVVKYWAKKRAINEPYHGTLSSYALLLMVINFLQQRRPPVLPCLQQMKDESGSAQKVIVEGFDCTYFTNTSRLVNFGSRNTESLGELLAGFWRFYAHEFDWNTQVVSVRTGRLLSKSEKEWTKHSARDKSYFALEDPFEITHNLGRVVDRNTLKAIRSEFNRAFRILGRGGDLDEICHVFTPFNEHNNSTAKHEK